ncbi:MAG: tetratricopeptide repeat protein [Polyangiaceae bacterium]|nr:tetratricopeptide repeat protein [Polyangiaceae bacterium]MCB9605190.1 tetratricopeptide repeat protein [Polyangiaceae bacterium]
MRYGILLALALATAQIGCSKKGTTEAQNPVGPPPNSAVGGGQVATPEGAQYAQTDGLSSGEASNRPQMNADAASAYNAGLEAFKNGDLDTAKKQFEAAISADSKAYRAYFSLGAVKERIDDEDGALRSYQKAIDVVKDYEPAIVAYAMLLASKKRFGEAESFLQSKSAAMPKSAAIPAAQAELKSIQKDSAGAQKLAQMALKRNPDYRPAMVTLARDHYRNRRLDLALYTLRAILDGFGDENPPRDKANAEARLLRALILREMGKRNAALDEFKEAVAARPDLVEARVSLAAFMLESGNAVEAAGLLEGALKYDRRNLLAHLNLGDAYRLLGRPDAALKELEVVKSREPTLAKTYYNLGLLYLFGGQMSGVDKKTAAEKAITAFEKYKELHPRAQPGDPDDTDELIVRAKSQKAIAEAEAKAPPPPPPAAPAAPAAGDAKAGDAKTPAKEEPKKGSSASF